MWAIRRASNPLKFRGFNRGISCACGVNSGILVGHSNCQPTISEHPQLPVGGSLFYHSEAFSSKFSLGRHGLSSQAGAKSGESESDCEDGFSELEREPSANAIEGGDSVDANEDELVSEPELSDDEDDDVEFSQDATELGDAEIEVGVIKTVKKLSHSKLFKAIIAVPSLPVESVLNKWVGEGKPLRKADISSVMPNLRKRRLYVKALQFSEWLEAHKQTDFVEKDYASRVDLIAKVHGLQKAEKYIEKIPNSYRRELVYRTLLANCVAANNPKKAEEVFNTMKDLEFPITTFACNQLLLLYKRLDKKKIADVLLLMEKENVKPSLFTYKTLIDTKGQSNDLTGMDQIVSTMKAEGVEPDVHTLSILAKHYASGGLKEKAESILKEMEGGDLKQNRSVCRLLLPLYATLGEADDVARVWKICESNPQLEECLAAIEAWGRLNKIDEAEEVFEKMSKTWKKLSSKHYAALLKVYANHKMLAKGKNLIKRMGDSGCRVGPLTWDALVKLYVESGEVEKADSMLNKVAQENHMKPMFVSYMAIMDQYVKRGDVHNAEKMFLRMKQAGYEARFRQYQALMRAYTNAKTPAYGMRERLKADNIFPNKGLAAQLAQVDAFRKTTVSDLLD